jgi:transcription antitermination factor NusG
MQLYLPLFPGYLFLRGGIERRLDLMTVYGVLGLVGTGGVPAAIEENEIEAIRRPTANAVHIEPHQYLSFGDWVRVTSGAFMGLAWIIHDFTGEKRKDALKGVMNTGFLANPAFPFGASQR